MILFYSLYSLKTSCSAEIRNKTSISYFSIIHQFFVISFYFSYSDLFLHDCVDMIIAHFLVPLLIPSFLKKLM